MRLKRKPEIIRVIAIAALLFAALFICGSISADPKQTPVTPGELIIRGSDGKSAGACPLKHTDVDAQISGFIARVTVVQEFSNSTGEKIEAVYTFPLPEDSAVDRMEMKIGTRTIVGEIHKREEARQIYEAAKNQGHVASLLDQERPNIFTQAVANIEPNAVIKITISYTQLLKYEAGTYKFYFPTVVGPRYMPGNPTGVSGTGTKPDTDAVPDASKISPPITPEGTRAGHDISIGVNINAGVKIQKVTCESHDVDTSYPNATTALVTLKDKATIPNKDFVLNYQVAGEAIQSGLIVYAPENNQGGYFSLIMQPPMAPKGNQITPKEMIFVIDTSGSQQGAPLAKSKETMLYCLKNVNPGDTFNMIAFSSGLKQLFDKPMPCNAVNLAAAEKFLAECESGGGTEMLPAIEAAFKPESDPKRLRIVVFFTDGYVGNDMQLIDCVQKYRGNARMFPFGIGSSVNRFLLEKMGEAGLGSTEVVLLNSDSKGIIEKFYNKIRSPLLTDISLDWHGLPITAEDMYPSIPPDLFAAQPLVLKGRYTGPAKGEITIKGRLGGRPWSTTLQVELPSVDKNNDSLASIWARAKVEDLMDKDWLGAQIGKPNPNIKEEVTKVALEYGLMTQYTSFVAVDRSTITGGGDARTVAVPVEMPEGVTYDGASSDSFGTPINNLAFSKQLAVPATGMAVRGMEVAANAAPAQYSVKYSDGSTTLQKEQQRVKITGSVNTFAVSSKFKSDAAAGKDEKGTANKAVFRLDKDLSDLLSNSGKTGKPGNTPSALNIKNGKVEVLISLSSATGKQLAELTKIGLISRKWVESGKVLRGWVPIKNLYKLAALDFVTKITPAKTKK